jgi:hypothetical protein
MGGLNLLVLGVSASSLNLRVATSIPSRKKRPVATELRSNAMQKPRTPVRGTSPTEPRSCEATACVPPISDHNNSDHRFKHDFWGQHDFFRAFFWGQRAFFGASHLLRAVTSDCSSDTCVVGSVGFRGLRCSNGGGYPRSRGLQNPDQSAPPKSLAPPRPCSRYSSVVEKNFNARSQRQTL